MPNMNRRSLVKGAAWVAPVAVVASAAPAVAASCTPVDDLKASTVKWTSTQPSYVQGDTEIHYVDYVFTNSGAVVLPEGAVFRIRVSYDVLTGVDSATEANVTSGSASVQVLQSGPTDNGDGSAHYDYDITVTTTAELAANEAISLTVTATYGALNSAVSESVSADSPMVSYDAATCTKTTTTIDFSGS